MMSVNVSMHVEKPLKITGFNLKPEHDAYALIITDAIYNSVSITAYDLEHLINLGESILAVCEELQAEEQKKAEEGVPA